MAGARRKSKKQSDASNSKPPESVVFFLDHSLGNIKIAGALRQAGETVEVHQDHFPGGTDDVDWLSEVGRRGWVVLTKDDKIRYRNTERLAVFSAEVAAFMLPTGNLFGGEMAAAFVKALPTVYRLLKKNTRPFIARVTKGGDAWIMLDSTGTQPKKRKRGD